MSEPTDSTVTALPTGSGRRYFLYGLMIAAAVVLFAFSGFMYWQLLQFRRHRQASDRMEIAIARLAFHRPGHLTDDQWAYCILLTWNLHSNYGVIPQYLPTDDLERIVAELEAKIEAGPDLATIDWLWDEYFKAYPRARNYDHWRPTLPANRSQFEAGAHGGYPLSHWRSEYKRMVSHR